MKKSTCPQGAPRTAHLTMGLGLMAALGCGSSDSSTQVPGGDNGRSGPRPVEDAVLPGMSATAWQPIELPFSTGALSPLHGGLPEEADRSPGNPWLDWRMDVDFTAPDGGVLRVPGFFAGDGNGGARGDVWTVRFTPPNQPGLWAGLATLRYGPGVNVDAVGDARGETVFSGHFRMQVAAPDPGAEGFFATGSIHPDRFGRLRSGDGSLFVKAGVGSPENFLAYDGFHGAMDGLDGGPNGESGGAPDFLHSFLPHVVDWEPGDPDWNGGQGRGIIGALNYLSEVGATAMYIMPMTLGGDGRDTFPFVSNSGGGRFPNDILDALNYSVARLDQWHRVLHHAQAKELFLQLVLAERESTNIQWLGGASSVRRRLYHKQLVAHFGHLPGLEWTMCEENGVPGAPYFAQFTPVELSAMAQWIRSWDVDAHPRSVHGEANDIALYAALLDAGSAQWMECVSLQADGDRNGGPGLYGGFPEEVAQLFRDEAGREVVVHMDEPGYYVTGAGSELHPGAWENSPEAGTEDRRRRILYDSLFSSAGVLWYFGYYPVDQGGGDLRTEDFRTRQTLLAQTRIARELMETTFRTAARFAPRDELWSSDSAPLHGLFGDAEVVSAPSGETLVYLPALGTSASVSPGTLSPVLEGPAGAVVFRATWINPRTGHDVGPSRTFDPSRPFRPDPPSGSDLDPDRDWVLRVEPE